MNKLKKWAQGEDNTSEWLKTVVNSMWIPCRKMMPEEEGIYLVTATNFIFDTEEITVGTCYFNIEYGFSNNRKILAWMPLPDPWKGADDETD